MRPSWKSALIVGAFGLAVILAWPPSGWAQEIPPGGSFLDDDGSVHEKDIEALAHEMVTKGCNPPWNDRYCPDLPVTRGQMAAFLARSLSLPPAPSTGFLDVADSTFAEEIGSLAAASITRGCNPPENDLFCPYDPVTRGEMAAFIVRALGLSDDGGDVFIDDDHSVFERDIDRLAAAEVTRGCNPPDNDRFCPDDPVTRAQMASFLTRALGFTPITPPEREVVFTVDEGINAGFDPWDESDQPGEFYERWRLWDRTLGCPPGSDLRPCTIDVSSENAEVWVKFPDGSQEEVASQLLYYPVRFIPTSPGGIYEFTFNLKDGTTHRAMIDFKESREVDLVRTGETRVVDGVRQIAFSLGGIDLRYSTHAMHRLWGVDGFLNSYVADEKEFWVPEDDLTAGEHTFAAKVEGRWSYAITTQP